jgi:hypothetical protein
MLSKGRPGMDNRSLIRTKPCRSYEDFIEELRKESDLEGYAGAEYKLPAQAKLESSVWGDGKNGNKINSKPAWLCKDCNKREAKPHNSKHYRDSEVKDLLLLGLFCFCLLVVNLACWSFFAGVPTGR